MESSNNNSVEQNVSSRRKFLTKVGAVSLISVVPSRTVWATNCTISGNLSNHASAVERCENSTVVFNGQNGTFWKRVGKTKLNSSGVTVYKYVNDIRQAFGITASGSAKPNDNSATSNAIEHVKNHIDNGEMSSDQIFNFDLRAALNGGGYTKDLASAYLNAYYGFYTLPNNISAKDYVIGLDQQVPHIYTQSEMEAAIEATHTDGSINGFPF